MLVQLSKLKELKFSRGPHAFKRHGLFDFQQAPGSSVRDPNFRGFFQRDPKFGWWKTGYTDGRSWPPIAQKRHLVPWGKQGICLRRGFLRKKHSMGNSLEDPITTKEVTYKEWYRCPGLRFHPWFIWLIQQTHEILTMVSVSWNLNTMRFGVHWTSQSSAENKATMK